MSDPLYAVILAGPNGAGKSTVQPFLIPPTMAFVNADNIARNLRETGSSTGIAADIAAGRLLVREIERLTATGQSFCVETNLASNGLAQRIPKWQRSGYLVFVYFFWLPAPELSIARVAQRVMAGGHDIPEATIRRRYFLGLRNFCETYAPLADRWRLYDNSGQGMPHLIESGVRRITDRNLWQGIRETALSRRTKNDNTGTVSNRTDAE